MHPNHDQHQQNQTDGKIKIKLKKRHDKTCTTCLFRVFIFKWPVHKVVKV